MWAYCLWRDMLDEVPSENCLLQKLDSLKRHFATLQDHVTRLDGTIEEILKFMNTSTFQVPEQCIANKDERHNV